MSKTFDTDDILGAFGSVPRKKDFIAGLNPKQAEAASTTDGPLAILAGAGTGKTTVLTNRIAHIIETKRATPQQVLAVTFTKKAAGELKHRLSKMLGDDRGRQVKVGNFHSICSEILRNHANMIDLTDRFTVLDEDGQRDVIATAAIARGFVQNKKDKTSINEFLQQISSWKEEGYDAEFIGREMDLSPYSVGPFQGDALFLGRASQIFVAYQEELRQHKWCDFADLILHTVRIFRKFPDIRAREASRYRYILVDEFQDTSPVQYEWVKLMAQDHQNICVVGDTDQSIYEWRSARPEIMLNFHKNWAGCKVVTIDTNYRSTQQILDVANIIVEPLREKDGLEKRLKGNKDGRPVADFFETYTSSLDEANAIARRIEQMIEDGIKPGEIAVLCRSGMIISVFERAMRTAQIRYTVAGAMKFTEREEIKDAMAFLTLAYNPMDYLSFERILKRPSRGIGPQKVSEIRRLMQQSRLTVKQAIDKLALTMNPRSVVAKQMGAFSQTLSLMEAAIEQANSAGQALEEILEQTGYMDYRLSNESDPQMEFRVENLNSLVNEATAYDSVADFLESMALQSAGDARMFDDSIVLSTVHASKGLEFDVVFCPAMEEGVFPNARSETTAFGPDEERRLAHVAFTRARKELRISWAKSRLGRRGIGAPSPYLFEIDMPLTGDDDNFGSYFTPPPARQRDEGPRKFRRRTF